ncbi:MAG: LamG-like jellyroll fold domain-containing protein [Saprospiraceae bacterium]
MKKILLLTLFFISQFILSSQVPGDTITVKSFNYSSTNRDTVVQFPNDPNITFEKIIMKYSMRCKNALVSNSSDTNLGCGEWDYSCNTFIVDSSKVEEVEATHPDYIISNFSGNEFNYTSDTIYDYFKYNLQSTELIDIFSEETYKVNSDNVFNSNIINTNNNSGKIQLLYTSQQLTDAGMTTGDLNGIILYAENESSTARFMKIKIGNYYFSTGELKYSLTKNVELTEVYNFHYNFKNGENLILFKEPYKWEEGTDLVIEISFTNSTIPDNNETLLQVSETDFTSCLSSYNSYAADFSSSGYVNIDTTLLSKIDDEISVSMWVYGNSDEMPANNSIIWGYDDNSSKRNLNVHLPWSNENVYFDCGYEDSGYDRIYKQATESEYEGKWNNWVFTKNVANGTMKIYINGQLWLSETEKTKNISIRNMILGMNASLDNNYKGKISNLTIWNKELDAATIEEWLYSELSDEHPYHDALIKNYKFNEGSGQSIYDEVNGNYSLGENLQWSFKRGENIDREFKESNLQPVITFIHGNYEFENLDIVETDSIARQPNIITQYEIKSNEGTFPISNDDINAISKTYLWESTPSIIYNGDTGEAIEEIENPIDGTITISDLTYTKRFPFYTEIMSFVTPYGIGLDLGENGQSWYFDVTDFTPILNGNKRIVMTMGGQNQEENGIEFQFIVGTPKRNILAFDQLWQGSTRTGSVAIAKLNAQSVLKPISIKTLENAETFKIRSVITGHGSQGEFQSNGGIIKHYVDINGLTAVDLNLNKDCASNPIFPQGGTWVYDRQGWCPGEASTINETDITDFFAPGSSPEFSCYASSPSYSSGDSRYLIAHQLISYGPLNFNTDINIKEIEKPSDKTLYSRSNPICSEPVIILENTGSETIKNLEIESGINNNTEKQTYSWSGYLYSENELSLNLPIGELWKNANSNSVNVFNVKVTKVNGGDDDYTYNNTMKSNFYVPLIVPSNFVVDFKTNNNPGENIYKLYDENGDIVDSQTFETANKLYTFNYNLSGCYKIVLTDTGHDGIQWWANSSQGIGYFKIKKTNNFVVKTFEPDFGSRIEVEFNTDDYVATDEKTVGDILLYPNPANTIFNIEAYNIDQYSISCKNITGQNINIPMSKHVDLIQFDGSTLASGIYFIVLTSKDNTIVKKIEILN